MKKYRLIALTGVFMTAAAACQSAPPPSAVEVAPTVLPATEAPAFPQEREEQAPTSAPIAPAEQEPAVPVEAPVKVRGGLAATDPPTVNLANGTPTLVEFFAFW